MRINDNPTKKQLEKLQNKLSKEGNVGITDIYGNMVQGYFALEAGGDLIGVASISSFEDGSAELFKLYIDSDQRGKGLGVYLLKETLNLLSSKGVTEVLVETTLESREFWEKIKATFSTTLYDYNKFGINVSG